MIHIQVPETGPGVEYVLSAHQAAALSAYGIVSVQSRLGGTWLLAGTGKVGAVQIGDMTVRVSPKLPIGRIFYLLGYGRKFSWDDDSVDYDTIDDLVHVIAEAFARQAERALGRGVMQGYVTRDDEMAVVRGRLRVREQVTRKFGQITPVLVTYDDFTIDIAENQLVRAAARVLRTVPGLNGAIARRLRVLIQRLDDVSDLVPGDRLPTWTPSRRNVHYDTVLWFATMILRQQSVDLPAGAVEMNGFIINMATVFEDFVAASLSDSLERIDGRVRAQDRHWFDEQHRVDMRPDLVWYRGGAPCAVIDTKYKAEKPAGYPNADLYQLLAYCSVLGLSDGHLVYAKGNEQPADITARTPGITIHAHALDLEAQPSALLAQVDALAQLIAGYLLMTNRAI